MCQQDACGNEVDKSAAGTGRLCIPSASRTSMGAYFCIASNGIPPSVSKRIQLAVSCKDRPSSKWSITSSKTLFFKCTQSRHQSKRRIPSWGHLRERGRSPWNATWRPHLSRDSFGTKGVSRIYLPFFLIRSFAIRSPRPCYIHCKQIRLWD